MTPSLRRKSSTFQLFKKHILRDMTPMPPNPFLGMGSKKGNILHTRLRLKSSQLNAHRYAQGKTESPSCSCGYPKEDTQHFLTLCPIYNSARATLLQKLSSVPNLAFSNLSRAQKMKVMITGSDGDYPTKKIVANAVQSFLLETQSRECIL